MRQAYMTIGYVRSLFDYAAEEGLPVTRLLDQMHIDVKGLQDQDLLVDADLLDPAFDLLEQLTADKCIGMHIGMRMRPQHLGILGLLLMTCTRMSELFELHGRYGQLISNATWPDYHIDQEYACLQLNHDEETGPLSRHRVEYSFSGWLVLARWVLGSDFTPARVEFIHPAPENVDEQQFFFNCPLLFNCPRTRIYFPAHHYYSPISHQNDDLRRTLELEARKRLAHLRQVQADGDLILKTVRGYIIKMLPHGVPEVQGLADEMGESVRSVQRQLEARHTNYKKLIDQVRQDMAQHYIVDDSLSLVDIALMLGFSDQTAFQKAFRRWFNCPPGKYRRWRHGREEESS